MNRILQGLLLLILIFPTVLPVLAEGDGGGELQGKYKRPTINPRLLGEDLSMVGKERDEYATNLTALAVKIVKNQKGSQESLNEARKLLGLALHLSPRNRKSLIVNGQLAKGVMPEVVVADYNTEVFSKLLLARGLLLAEAHGASNSLLSRYFITLAATMNPRNEDAVYEAEMLRIDHGDLSWSAVTDAKRHGKK